MLRSSILFTVTHVAANNQSFTVVVNVYLDEHNDLQAEIVENSSDEIAFTNTFTDNTEIEFNGTKTLTGRALEDKEFSFIVTDNATGAQVVTGTNAAAADGVEAAIKFDAIGYSQADVGLHSYTVTDTSLDSTFLSVANI